MKMKLPDLKQFFDIYMLYMPPSEHPVLLMTYQYDFAEASETGKKQDRLSTEAMFTVLAKQKSGGKHHAF